MVRITSNQGVPVYGLKTFLLDSVSEVDSLPVIRIAPGSRAFVSEDSSQYILNTNYKWVKVNFNGGSGGGGGDDDHKEIIYDGGAI